MYYAVAAQGRLPLDTAVAKLLPGAPARRSRRQRETSPSRTCSPTPAGWKATSSRDTGRGDGCVRRTRRRSGRGGAGSTHPARPIPNCNSGFTGRSARIIEVLDGRTWDEVAARCVYWPARPAAITVTLPEEEIVHRTAVSDSEPPALRLSRPPAWASCPASAGPAGTLYRQRARRAHLRPDAPERRAPSQDGTRLLVRGRQWPRCRRYAARPAPGTGPPRARSALALHLAAGEGPASERTTTAGPSRPECRPFELPLSLGPARLLTNGSSMATLYRELFAEVFTEFAGISPPPPRRPRPSR